MTTLARITIAVLIALFLSSCGFDINLGPGVKGDGNVTKENRKITHQFTAVSASEGLDVYVTQADEFKITVEADENVIDLIGTDISNGKLRIHARENIGRATKKVFVSLPVVTELESSSGANLTVKNVLNADHIEIGASSGSGIGVNLKASEIRANASSGANIKISGEASNLEIHASSGSGIGANDLRVKTCNAKASSGADISINVSDTLIADASSGANINYSGDATVEQKKSVSGSVRKL
ncbi:DUF2807 domain-containing protein [Flavobacteriaceae bacterium F89]|uniref:DUF2807 domain-containing protein n=1 Tax=Cerina litoralis TaxID=2874477 RepID=A0AAE3EWA5_9FLAO|nr:head GIN domain-containing protein [Cerina litoralis]MCG2462252.1 DUF2807 domain-containing protein [Cerina litoralis]